ncbi:CACTA en-spm transposon protein [Cucumis melo var. makuwa]|uniref:CACTA en-spm transposon protein n=1 Tax=Cucumis melo var. makuwa TaxID=1194695 RepID=A0A5A7UFK8_CUCMM|nr:CACTA en-spm transposon protein [Cucumis melo var. makuwa]TYK01865.1 CACTA en-spm transposon protein [Cucumis melo var. makuwa]
MSERDSRRTTQNNGVMVIGESNVSGSGDNNFYGVLDKVLHVQYLMGRSFWLFKYQCTMSSFSIDFEETDVIFLEFHEDLNTAEGSSMGDDNLVCCLRWDDVGREYIEVVKGDLQRFFMLHFNDHAMNIFVEHQMLTCFKEFMGDCHRYFKMCIPQSWMKKTARQKQPYNHSKGLSLLHGVLNHSLGTRYVRLFWVDDRATQKALVGDSSLSPTRRSVLAIPRPCTRNPRISNYIELHEVKRAIEEQRKTSEMLASQVEQMRKLIEDMSWAQRGS